MGFAQGFLKEEAGVFTPHDAFFGHPGTGGCLGFADPETGISFGYVMNRMRSHVRSPTAMALSHSVTTRWRNNSAMTARITQPDTARGAAVLVLIMNSVSFAFGSIAYFDVSRRSPFGWAIRLPVCLEKSLPTKIYGRVLAAVRRQYAAVFGAGVGPFSTCHTFESVAQYLLCSSDSHIVCCGWEMCS